jgi:Tfp pilus assembly protein PilW
VPYAEFADPQSLNLYTYVRNIPTTRVDADGHCAGDDCNKITVTAEKVGEPTMTPRASGPGTNSAEVAGQIRYTLNYDGKPLTNTQVHERITARTTRNGSRVPATLKTGTANTKKTGQVLDKVSIGASGPAQPPLNNSAAHELTTNVFTEKQTQVMTFQSPSGETCTVTEQRTLTNADANGHASENYTLNLNSPATQTAKPVRPPKSKATH